jgi:hypothetical protein
VDRPGCGAGWARARRIGRDGTWASTLCVSGVGAGSSVRTDDAFGARMGCMGRASGAGLVVRQDAGATSGRTPRLDVRALVALLIHASPGM